MPKKEVLENKPKTAVSAAELVKEGKSNQKGEFLFRYGWFVVAALWAGLLLELSELGVFKS